MIRWMAEHKVSANLDDDSAYLGWNEYLESETGAFS